MKPSEMILLFAAICGVATDDYEQARAWALNCLTNQNRNRVAAPLTWYRRGRR